MMKILMILLLKSGMNFYHVLLRLWRVSGMVKSHATSIRSSLPVDLETRSTVARSMFCSSSLCSRVFACMLLWLCFRPLLTWQRTTERAHFSLAAGLQFCLHFFSFGPTLCNPPSPPCSSAATPSSTLPACTAALAALAVCAALPRMLTPPSFTKRSG